jgi:hypothetical protein
MKAEKKYKFLDLSGYGFSGKHAVIDLVREFRGYHVPHFAFEFNLIRIQGGIRDLETALVDDWSPVRSDAAIRRFKRLVKRLGSKNRWTDPRSWFSAVGWNYDEYYNRRFFELSDEYIAGLVTATWVTDWPYPLGELSGCELFVRKLARILGIKGAYDFEVNLAAPDRFLELTRTYLARLLSSKVSEDTTAIVMHNAFEPFNPQRSLRYFESARCIVVDRDPRDTFVDQLKYRPMRLPVDEFIRRYRLYRRIAARNLTESKDILRIRFEDLVLEYDHMVTRILDFLGEVGSIHATPKKYFDPTVSIKNVGMWKQYGRQGEIEKIYRELREYCREF